VFVFNVLNLNSMPYKKMSY